MNPNQGNQADEGIRPVGREMQGSAALLPLNLQLFAPVNIADIIDENDQPVFASLDTSDAEGGENEDTTLEENTEEADDAVQDPLFIPRLAVTDRNMPQSSVGEAVVVNADGELYSVSIDDEGAVTETRLSIGAEHLEDGVITGLKLEESTITSRELDMEEIFADSALVSQILAANIDAEGLFENQGFLDRLAARTVARTGDVMQGVLTLSGNPEGALDAAPKQYVDQAIQAAIQDAWAASY